MKNLAIQAADGGRFNAYVALPPDQTGPGLVLLHEAFGVTSHMRRMADRFAEDGYVVLVPDLYWRIQPGVELSDAEFDRAMELYQKFDADLAIKDIEATIGTMRKMSQHVGGVGVVGFCLGGTLAALTAARTDIDCAVSYYGVGIANHLDEMEKVKIPISFHYGTEDEHCQPEFEAMQALVDAHRGNMSLRMYPNVGHGFANDDRAFYDPGAAELAFTRALTTIRSAIGPKFDIEGIWETHLYHEFVTKDAAETLKTMVDNPYVNIAPTLTGGVGHDMLLRFYKYHFVDVHPEDTRMISISRTVGVNRVVDEMIMCFTHDREIPYLLPGIEPTGRYMKVPMVAIVSFKGGKVYNEHIYWDQASVLVQAGLLEKNGLPIMGSEIADKLLDKNIRPNDLMMDIWATSEGKPI